MSKSTKINFTGSELAVLRSAYASADRNGHDFGFVETVVKGVSGPDLNKQAVGAIITNLVKKGMIKVWSPVTTDSGTFTQFTWCVDPQQIVDALMV